MSGTIKVEKKKRNPVIYQSNIWVMFLLYIVVQKMQKSVILNAKIHENNGPDLKNPSIKPRLPCFCVFFMSNLHFCSFHVAVRLLLMHQCASSAPCLMFLLKYMEFSPLLGQILSDFTNKRPCTLKKTEDRKIHPRLDQTIFKFIAPRRARMHWTGSSKIK